MTADDQTTEQEQEQEQDKVEEPTPEDASEAKAKPKGKGKGKSKTTPLPPSPTDVIAYIKAPKEGAPSGVLFRDRHTSSPDGVYIRIAGGSAALLAAPAGRAMFDMLTRKLLYPYSDQIRARVLREVAGEIYLRGQAAVRNRTPLGWQADGTLYIWASTTPTRGDWWTLDGRSIRIGGRPPVVPIGDGLQVAGPIQIPSRGRRDAILADLLSELSVDSEVARRWAEVVLVMIPFMPARHRPIVHLVGEQGSGKSTLAQIVKLIWTGNSTFLLTPANERDFVACARDQITIDLDNFDTRGDARIREQLATMTTNGGVFRQRALHTNADAVSFQTEGWPIVTSQTGETINRDDIVARQLVVQFVRRPLTDGAAFEDPVGRLEGRRIELLGATLSLVNDVVAQLRALPPRAARFRWVDGERIAEALCRLRGWDLGEMLDYQTAAQQLMRRASEGEHPTTLVDLLCDTCEEQWLTASEIARLVQSRIKSRPLPEQVALGRLTQTLSPREVGRVLTDLAQGRQGADDWTVERGAANGCTRYRSHRPDLIAVLPDLDSDAESDEAGRSVGVDSHSTYNTTSN